MKVIDINEVKCEDHTSVFDGGDTYKWEKYADPFVIFDETVVDQIRVEPDQSRHFFTMSQKRYKKGHHKSDENLTVYMFDGYVSYKAGIFPHKFDRLTPESVASKIINLLYDKDSILYDRDIVRVSEEDSFDIGDGEYDWMIHFPERLFESLILKEIFGDGVGFPVINTHEGKDYGRIVKVAFCSPEVIKWYENQENKK